MRGDGAAMSGSDLSCNRGLRLLLTTALTPLTLLYHSRHDRSKEGRERKEVRLGRCGANDAYAAGTRSRDSLQRRPCSAQSAVTQATQNAGPRLYNKIRSTVGQILASVAISSSVSVKSKIPKSLSKWLALVLAVTATTPC